MELLQQCSTRAGPLSWRRVRHGGVRDVAGVRPLLQTLLLLDAQDGAQQVEAGEASINHIPITPQGFPCGHGLHFVLWHSQSSYNL